MKFNILNRQVRSFPAAYVALLPVAMLTLWCHDVKAQAAPAPAIPSAGQVLRELEPSGRAAPAPATAPVLRIVPTTPGTTASASAMDTTPIAVKSIELIGNTVFDTATLRALVVDAEGSTQTFEQLNALAQRITDYYRANGQPLASAYLPVQTMNGGVLRISVVEAVYGRITVDNRSRMSTASLKAYLSPLQPGQLITQAPLDRSLLLLRELAGIDVSAEARPGILPGSSDLTITAVDIERISGTFSLDNQGSAGTGRGRAIGAVELSNQFGRGETVSAVAVTSGQGMNYGRLSLQMPVNSSGTRVGVGYARLNYVLGDVFASLKAYGSAGVLDGFVQHALVRSLSTTVNVDLRLEHKVLQDRVDLNGTRTDRTLTSATTGLNAELRDGFGGGGNTSVALGVSAGRVAFNDATAQALDQSTTGAHTQGAYGHVNLTLARSQSLGGVPYLARTTLFASLRAQVASTNLDLSEQFSVAGPQGVRGYDVNALSGAQGYVASVELRQLLAQNTSGAWQAKAFVDMGQATVYKNVFTSVPNTASMRGIGLGLNWAAPSGWNAQLSLARPVGPSPAIAAERNTRVWLMVAGKF